MVDIVEISAIVAAAGVLAGVVYACFSRIPVDIDISNEYRGQIVS